MGFFNDIGRTFKKVGKDVGKGAVALSKTKAVKDLVKKAKKVTPLSVAEQIVKTSDVVGKKMGDDLTPGFSEYNPYALGRKGGYLAARGVDRAIQKDNARKRRVGGSKGVRKTEFL